MLLPWLVLPVRSDRNCVFGKLSEDVNCGCRCKAMNNLILNWFVALEILHLCSLRVFVSFSMTCTWLQHLPFELHRTRDTVCNHTTIMVTKVMNDMIAITIVITMTIVIPHILVVSTTENARTDRTLHSYYIYMLYLHICIYIGIYVHTYIYIYISCLTGIVSEHCCRNCIYIEENKL